MVASIKTIPAFRRQYLPARKLWLVHNSYKGTVIRLLEEMGYEIKGGTTAISPSNLFDQLFNLAPVQHQTKLYHSLVTIFHPDIGGTKVTMQQLNQAWTNFKEEEAHDD